MQRLFFRLLKNALPVLALMSPLTACGDDATGTSPDGDASTSDTDTVAGACTTHFGCTAAAPYCRVTAGVGACLAPLDECVDDDPGETDDGPMSATEINFGAPLTAKSCTGSGLERDWYRFSIAAATSLEVRVTWMDLDAHFYAVVFDASGAKVVSLEGGAEDGASWDDLSELSPGIYFVEIDPNTIGFGEPDGGVAIAYTLTITAE